VLQPFFCRHPAENYFKIELNKLIIKDFVQKGCKAEPLLARSPLLLRQQGRGFRDQGREFVTSSISLETAGELCERKNRLLGCEEGAL
jgi:hypothetical protein